MKGERIGEFEEVVMLTVRLLGREAHSVSIQEMLRERAARRASLGAIYAAMDRLERKGMARSWLAASTGERGGRRKRCYELTAAGERALTEVRRVRDRLWDSPAAPLADIGSRK